MTLTPFVTTGGAALMEGEYRQRFASGGFDFWGVVAIDDGLDDDGLEAGGGFGRGAFHTTGEFRLPRDFAFDFDLAAASRRQLPHPVRLFRHRPAHQLRPHPPHPGRGVHRARHHRLPDPHRPERVDRRPLRPAAVQLPAAARLPGPGRAARHLGEFPRHPARERQQLLPRRRPARLAARPRCCRTASSPPAPPRRSWTATRSGTIPASPTASCSRPPRRSPASCAGRSSATPARPTT